jgi:cephalosporin hydroxylase
MHHSAYVNAENFYNKYCSENIENKNILDVGSYDVNGSLKPIFQKGKYVGMDMEAGPNVDVVSDAHDIPFKNDFFDIIISSSCFEHDDMFWVTFLEMCRVLKPGGFMYIQAPSNGPYHGYPGDNWRFYIDSWKALEKWGKLKGFDLEVIESLIDSTTPDPYQQRIWDDSIGIFRKKESQEIKFDLKSIEIGHHNLLYRGVKNLKCPFDYVTYQMIVNEIKPDLIIEIGTHYGGNAIYLADLLEIIGSGEVHTIDIEKFGESELLDNHPRIKRFFGGYQEYNLNLAKGFSTVLVIDDGSHQYQDVLNSFEKFKDIVSLNSYFIIEDGILSDLGYNEAYEGGPSRAISEIIPLNNNFIVDRKWCDFFGKNATFNPNGFLRKIRI